MRENRSRNGSRLHTVLAFVLAAGAALLPAVGPAPAEGRAVVARRCEEVRLAVPADLAIPKNARTVRVVLPSGYDDPVNATRRYPVVLMLHGMGGTFRAWTRATDLVTYSSRFDAIFVTPDGDGRHGVPKGGWYSD
jgi:poly(3-hydroxybutyrate) depolymerase